MEELNFYVCEHCGNLVEAIEQTKVPMMCCGQKMTKIQPGVVEASIEKHLPVVAVLGNVVKVTVGQVEHPMVAEHSILWVCLQTDKGVYRKKLQVGSEPTVKFAIMDEKPLAVYAYCNLHGLWKTEIVEKPVCNLKPLDVNPNQNYTVCNCNNVSYQDILKAIYAHDDISTVMDIFEDVKNTTKCSTGCGGCYDKVVAIISEVLANGEK